MGSYASYAVRDSSGTIIGYQSAYTGQITYEPGFGPGGGSALYNALTSQYAQQHYNTVGSGGTYQQSAVSSLTPTYYDTTSAAGIAAMVGQTGGAVDLNLAKTALSEGASPSIINLASTTDTSASGYSVPISKVSDLSQIKSGIETLPTPSKVYVPSSSLLSSGETGEKTSVATHIASSDTTSVGGKSSSGAHWSPYLIPTYDKSSLPTGTTTRSDYYSALSAGDTKTQELATELATKPYLVNTIQPYKSYNEAVEVALEQQRESFTGKAQSFYGNELQKLIESNVGTSSEYHYQAAKSGVPVAANPYEYLGDLSVEFLKGSPIKSSEFFSPVSGELKSYLPSSGGLQEWAWNRAEGKNEAVSYMPALAYLASAEGLEGPYGALYGGTGAKSVTSSDVSARLAAWSGAPRSESVTTIMPTQITAAESTTLPTPYISKPITTTTPSSSEGPIGVLASNLFQGKLPSIGALWESTPIARIASNWTWDTSNISSDINTAVSARPKTGTEGLLNLAGIIPLGSEAGVAEKAVAPVAEKFVSTEGTQLAKENVLSSLFKSLTENDIEHSIIFDKNLNVITTLRGEPGSVPSDTIYKAVSTAKEMGYTDIILGHTHPTIQTGLSNVVYETPSIGLIGKTSGGIYESFGGDIKSILNIRNIVKSDLGVNVHGAAILSEEGALVFNLPKAVSENEINSVAVKYNQYVGKSIESYMNLLESNTMLKNMSNVRFDIETQYQKLSRARGFTEFAQEYGLSYKLFPPETAIGILGKFIPDTTEGLMSTMALPVIGAATLGVGGLAYGLSGKLPTIGGITTQIGGAEPTTVNKTEGKTPSVLIPSSFDLWASNLNIPVLSGAAVATSDFLLSGTNPIAGIAKQASSIANTITSGNLSDVISGKSLLSPDSFSRYMATTTKGTPVLFSSLTIMGEPITTTKQLADGSYETITTTPSTTTQGYSTPISTIYTPVTGGFETISKNYGNLIVGVLPSSVKDWYNSPTKTSGNFFISGDTGSFGIGTDYTNAFLKGAVKNVVEDPLTTIMNVGVGAALAATGEGLASYGTKLVGVTEGTGALSTIARGTNWFVNKAAPVVLGGLYAVDVGGRSTSWGKDLTPTAAQKFGGIFSTETGPMILGGSLWANRGAIKESLPSVEGIKTGARNIYETANFPNIPTVGDIGGGLREQSSDVLFSLRQRAAGQINLGPESGLSYYTERGPGIYETAQKTTPSKVYQLPDLTTKNIAGYLPSSTTKYSFANPSIIERAYESDIEFTPEINKFLVQQMAMKDIAYSRGYESIFDRPELMSEEEQNLYKQVESVLNIHDYISELNFERSYTSKYPLLETPEKISERNIINVISKIKEPTISGSFWDWEAASGKKSIISSYDTSTPIYRDILSPLEEEAKARQESVDYYKINKPLGSKLTSPSWSVGTKSIQPEKIPESDLFSHLKSLKYKEPIRTKLNIKTIEEFNLPSVTVSPSKTETTIYKKKFELPNVVSSEKIINKQLLQPQLQPERESETSQYTLKNLKYKEPTIIKLNIKTESELKPKTKNDVLTEWRIGDAPYWSIPSPLEEARINEMTKYKTLLKPQVATKQQVSTKTETKTETLTLFDTSPFTKISERVEEETKTLLNVKPDEEMSVRVTPLVSTNIEPRVETKIKEETKTTTDLTTDTKITKIIIPEIIIPPLLGGTIPPGGGGGAGPGKRYKRHEQIFSYNFDPYAAARVTAKALKVGSNIVFGQKSSLPTFGLNKPAQQLKVIKPTTQQSRIVTKKSTVPKLNISTQQKKVTTPQFKMPIVGLSKVNTGLKSMSLPSSLPQKKKKGKK